MRIIGTRQHFAQPGEGRRPTLTWPRQIPIDGEPADVAEVIGAYAEWLPTSSIPKLLVRGEPGALLATDTRTLELCRGWAAQTEVMVRGIHFLQKDSPGEIGRSVANWLSSLG